MTIYEFVSKTGYEFRGHAIVQSAMNQYFDLIQCDDLRIVVVEINVDSSLKLTPRANIVAVFEPDSLLHGMFGKHEIPSLLSIKHYGGQYSVITLQWTHQNDPFNNEKMFDFHGKEIKDSSCVENEYKRQCTGKKRPTKLHLRDFEPHPSYHFGVGRLSPTDNIGYIDRFNDRSPMGVFDSQSDLGRFLKTKKSNTFFYRITYHQNYKVNQFYLMEKHGSNFSIHVFDRSGYDRGYVYIDGSNQKVIKVIAEMQKEHE